MFYLFNVNLGNKFSFFPIPEDQSVCLLEGWALTPREGAYSKGGRLLKGGTYLIIWCLAWPLIRGGT